MTNKRIISVNGENGVLFIGHADDDNIDDLTDAINEMVEQRAKQAYMAGRKGLEKWPDVSAEESYFNWKDRKNIRLRRWQADYEARLIADGYYDQPPSDSSSGS